MTQAVTAEYIEGIKEGRAFMKRFEPDIPMIRNNIENLKMTMREFSPGPVKDMLKGECDFWQNQLKLKMCQRAGRG